MSSSTFPKKEILRLDHLIGKRIHVKFQGTREVEGILKGYDQLVNLVLEDANELLPPDQTVKRKLGMTICRGPLVMLICPEDGFEEIPNPFLNAETNEE